MNLEALKQTKNPIIILLSTELDPQSAMQEENFNKIEDVEKHIINVIHFPEVAQHLQISKFPATVTMNAGKVINIYFGVNNRIESMINDLK